MEAEADGSGGSERALWCISFGLNVNLINGFSLCLNSLGARCLSEKVRCGSLLPTRAKIDCATAGPELDHIDKIPSTAGRPRNLGIRFYKSRREISDVFWEGPEGHARTCPS